MRLFTPNNRIKPKTVADLFSVGLKYCPACKHIRNITEYRPDSSNKKYGLHAKCLHCEEGYRKSDKGKVANRRGCAKWRKTEKGKVCQRKHNTNEEYKQKMKALRSSPAGKEKSRTISAKRRKQLKLATPNWLTEKHKEEIDAYYSLREEYNKSEPRKYSVDHIEPIISDSVCGLHVPWNLQYMLTVNNSKKNSY